LHWDENRFWHSTPKVLAEIWNSYSGLLFGTGKDTSKPEKKQSNIVYRDGKPYIKKSAKDCGWTKSIF
jgi:hypothetical protein